MENLSTDLGSDFHHNSKKRHLKLNVLLKKFWLKKNKFKKNSKKKKGK
jgi:hypothetical protein